MPHEQVASFAQAQPPSRPQQETGTAAVVDAMLRDVSGSVEEDEVKWSGRNGSAFGVWLIDDLKRT